MPKTISTPYGEFKLVRKDVVAISVVRPKHRVRHHRIEVTSDELTHIEHRRVPADLHQFAAGTGGWAHYIATYDLDGNPIELS